MSAEEKVVIHDPNNAEPEGPRDLGVVVEHRPGGAEEEMERDLGVVVEHQLSGDESESQESASTTDIGSKSTGEPTLTVKIFSGNPSSWKNCGCCGKDLPPDDATLTGMGWVRLGNMPILSVLCRPCRWKVLDAIKS